MIPGIDTSHLQGPIDYAAVATAGYKFALSKGSEGTGFTDPNFAKNYAATAEAGLYPGSYEFLHPDQDPIAEAQRFLAALASTNSGSPLLRPGDLPAFLDLEWIAGHNPPPAVQYLAKVQAWLDDVEEATGRTPGIYTSAPFWNPYTGSSTAFSRYPLWVPAYGAAAPSLPAGWTAYTIWQTSGSGRVPGIGTACDKNLFNGDDAALALFAGITALATPAIPAS